MNERSAGILIRATEAYVKVVADPETAGPRAAELVTEARRAGDDEALVAALRAEAWWHRIRLEGARAKRLLDDAVRIGRRTGMTARLGEVLVTRGAVNHELGRPAAAQRDFAAAARLIAADMAAELAAQQGALAPEPGPAGGGRPALPAGAGLSRRPHRRTGQARQQPRRARGRARPAAGRAGLAGPGRGRGRRWSGRRTRPTSSESRATVTVQAGRLTEGLALFREAGQAVGVGRAAARRAARRERRRPGRAPAAAGGAGPDRGKPYGCWTGRACR